MGIVIIGIFSIIDYHDLCMYIPIIYIVTTPYGYGNQIDTVRC